MRLPDWLLKKITSAPRDQWKSVPPVPSPAAACPPPTLSSTRRWLLDCEIGGGGDATESRQYEPDMEVRTDRERWRSEESEKFQSELRGRGVQEDGVGLVQQTDMRTEFVA